MKMITQDRILDVIARIVEHRGTQVPVMTEASDLYQGGIGLDSLDAATLSALLEQEFGHDPYSEGRFPRTIGDILAFYQQQPEDMT